MHDIALDEILDIAHQHLDELDDESRSRHADTGQLATLVLSLHDWLIGGGAMPAVWGR